MTNLEINNGEQEILAVSIVSVYELEKGARLTKSQDNLRLVRELLSELVILEPDRSSVDIASQIYSDLGKKGKLIGEFEILISSICMTGNHRLVTNESDFDQIQRLTKLHY